MTNRAISAVLLLLAALLLGWVLGSLISTASAATLQVLAGVGISWLAWLVWILITYVFDSE